MTRAIFKFGGHVPGELLMSSAQVATLTRPQREARVGKLIAHSDYMLDQALDIAAWHGGAATPRLAVASG